jgi:hypothetical protein
LTGRQGGRARQTGMGGWLWVSGRTTSVCFYNTTSSETCGVSNVSRLCEKVKAKNSYAVNGQNLPKKRVEKTIL